MGWYVIKPFLEIHGQALWLGLHGLPSHWVQIISLLTKFEKTGIRNYVARNNLRAMKKGELAFFYHSNCKEPGIVGTMEITGP